MAVKVLPKSDKLYAELKIVSKYCITKSPGFAGIALLPQYYIVDPKDPEMGKEYGFTDGRSVWLGARLFKDKPKVQAFVLIHEILHLALRHPQRALALKKATLARGQPWSGTVFNWAADAIVHHSMRGLTSWVHKPSFGIITFENLLTKTELATRPAHRWNVEALFAFVMSKIAATFPDSAIADAIKEWAKSNLPYSGNGMLDLELAMESSNVTVEADSNIEARNWEGRVKRAAAGDSPGGVMREILFDIPVTTTPWRHILRKFITAAVMQQTDVKPSKPSKHTIVLAAYNSASNISTPTPFYPAFKSKDGIRRIVIVVDTSGSIDDTMCEYFAGEIQSIRKKLGSDLTLITCDAAVHQTISVRPSENLASVIKRSGGFKGKGGTNFVPGVEAAEKVPGASVIVYLTDMMGPYPQSCKLPLLWASTEENYTKPPIGQVVVIKR